MFNGTDNIVKSLRIDEIVYCYSEAKGVEKGKNCFENQDILS